MHAPQGLTKLNAAVLTCMHAATEAAQGELQTLESELGELKSKMADLKKVDASLLHVSQSDVTYPLQQHDRHTLVQRHYTCCRCSTANLGTQSIWTSWLGPSTTLAQSNVLCAVACLMCSTWSTADADHHINGSKECNAHSRTRLVVACAVL